MKREIREHIIDEVWDILDEKSYKVSGVEIVDYEKYNRSDLIVVIRNSDDLDDDPDPDNPLSIAFLRALYLELDSEITDAYFSFPKFKKLGDNYAMIATVREA